MATGNLTMNVRHRVGLLGNAMIAATRILNRFGFAMPIGVVTWAVNHSSFISIDGGRWQRMKLDLNAGEFAE